MVYVECVEIDKRGNTKGGIEIFPWSREKDYGGDAFLLDGRVVGSQSRKNIMMTYSMELDILECDG